MTVKAIPEGYHSLTPYLLMKDSLRFSDFLHDAFGATEMFRMEHPAGSGIRHAEVRIGDSTLMFGEARPEHPACPGIFYLYVSDVDRAYERALAAGTTSLREPHNEFYGDRSAGVEDGWGNTWWLATHVEDVSPEEMERREAAFKQRKNNSA
jgi:PhnB protein